MLDWKSILNHTTDMEVKRSPKKNFWLKTNADVVGILFQKIIMDENCR